MAKLSGKNSRQVDSPDDDTSDTDNEETEQSSSKIQSVKIKLDPGDKNLRINRRRMAWVALISCIVVMILTLFYVDVDRLKVLEVVITWFYFGMISIVGAYIGFTTVFDMKKK